MVDRIKSKKGFTLIELMIAISIIITMGAVAVIGISTYLKAGRTAQTRSGVAVLTSALGRYRYVHGALPRSLKDLTAANANGNKGQLLSADDLKDAWNNTYNYAISSQNDSYAIWSNGPDQTNNSGSSMPTAFGHDDIGLILHL